jgi:hypothetical protein
MPGGLEWVLLAYRMPREPSTPRIAVWRKLRRLGVGQVVDGLVALPAGSRTREHLEWTAADVLDAGGEAFIWIGRMGSAASERQLIASMDAVVAADYQTVQVAAAAAATEDEGVRRRTLSRLRREIRKIGDRDHFASDERERTAQAVDGLASTLVDV